MLQYSIDLAAKQAKKKKKRPLNQEDVTSFEPDAEYKEVDPIGKRLKWAVLTPWLYKVAKFSLKYESWISVLEQTFLWALILILFLKHSGTKRVVSPLKCHFVSWGKEKICHSYFTGQSKYWRNTCLVSTVPEQNFHDRPDWLKRQRPLSGWRLERTFSVEFFSPLGLDLHRSEHCLRGKII